MFDVENMPAELFVLSGSRIAAGSATIGAGGVGTFTQIQLQNPAGSGVIVRVITSILRPSTTDFINLGLSQTFISANAGVEDFFDSRLFGQGTVAQIFTDNAAVATGPAFLRFRVENNPGLVFHPPLAVAVLAPGAALEISCATANLSLDASFQWMERVAEPSELNL